MTHLNKTICIILGMHRSGTSLLAGVLHNSGISMGSEDDFYPPPDKDNAKGHFENVRFRRINDSLLKSRGYITKHWNPTLYLRQHNSKRRPPSLDHAPNLRALRGLAWLYTEGIRHSSRRKMLRTINRYNRQHVAWGWKDPRQMLTMREWYNALAKSNLTQSVRVVLIHRNPISVAQSLLKRGNVQSIHHGVAIWQTYNQNVLNVIDELQIPVFTLSFERLVANPLDTTFPLSNYLNVEIDASFLKKFISPKLVHNQTAYDSGRLDERLLHDEAVMATLSRLKALEQKSYA